MKNAIEAARSNAKSLLVKQTDVARQYRVLNKNTQFCYLVRFFRNSDGKKFGQCSCKAGEHGVLCKHIAAAAALNMCLAEQGQFNNMD